MFEVKNKALLFVESSEIASTTNIREALKCSVLEKYRSSLNKFQKNFTKVTDSANVMAKFANASVNTGIGSPDETWIGRLVHFLNNTMNHCIDSSNRESILQNCGVKFSGHEKIAEGPNRGGWHQYLPGGFKLIQEVENRFRTHYMAAKRFLNAAFKVLARLESRNKPITFIAFDGRKKKTDAVGVISSCPATETICDAFRIVMLCTERFE